MSFARVTRGGRSLRSPRCVLVCDSVLVWRRLVVGEMSWGAPDAQARLRALEVVAGLVGDGIITLDASGRVVDWNDAASSLTGYAPDEVRGRSVSVLYTEEDKAADLLGREL